MKEKRENDQNCNNSERNQHEKEHENQGGAATHSPHVRANCNGQTPNGNGDEDPCDDVGRQ